jgi:hypothetical protein
VRRYAGKQPVRLAAARRFVLQVYRLGRDIIQRFPAEMLRILVAGGASLACQGFALAALYAYLRALENNGSLLGLAARTTPLLFLLVAGATLVLLIGFALLEYYVTTAILSVTRRYQNLGTGEVMALSSRLPHWFSGDGVHTISPRHLRQLIAVDVHHRSRMARILMLAMIPAARLVVCALALLYLNPEFSLVILLAVGIPVAGLYSVGRKVADTITIREMGSPPVFQQQREILDKHWAQGAPLDAADIEWETTLGQPDSRFRLFFRRLHAKAHGAFLINMANTVGIMVLVVALGFWILNARQGNWSLWLTYLVALRYFLSSMRRTAQAVISSTRFLRQTQRYCAFIDAATLAVNSPDPRAVPCPEHVAQAYKGASSGAVSDDDDDDDDDD